MTQTVAAAPSAAAPTGEWIGRAGRQLGLLLFFLMLFLPTTYQRPKYALLAVLLAIVALAALRAGRLRLDRLVGLITVAMAATGLGFLALGEINGAAPGAIKLATVYVLWPIVFTLLLAGIDAALLALLPRVLVAAAVVIAVYSVLTILHDTALLPPGPFLELDVGKEFGFRDGVPELSTNYTATLIFLVPFFIATIMAMPRESAIASRPVLWLGLASGIIMVIVSGRRGLLLAILAAPLVTLAFTTLLRRKVMWLRRVSPVRAFVAIMVISVLVFSYLGAYGFSVQELAAMFRRGFEFNTGDESAYIRGEQFRALLAGWAESPLLGHGLGTTAVGSLRSNEFSWAYELSYLSLLFHTGIAGVLLYAWGLAWLYANARRALESGMIEMRPLLPVMVGTTCFLLGNATNPYLEKFDFLWVLFLPIAYVNHWRLARPESAQIQSRT